MVEPGTDEGPSLGQMLRARREARGLTREQAAQQARVQLVFVRALEEDDYHPLPDEMYLTRFLYEYATFLGLDPALADAAFRRHLRRERRTTPLYRALPRLAVLPWRRVLWTAGVLLPVVPVVFIVMSLAGREGAPPVPPSGPEPGIGPEWERNLGPAPAVAPPAARPASGSIAIPTEPASRVLGGAPPDVRRASRHLLVARARQVTWLSIQVDGVVQREVLLREGETARWEAERGFILTVGNAAGVEVTLDGQPVPLPPGRGGVVRRLRLPEIQRSGASDSEDLQQIRDR